MFCVIPIAIMFAIGIFNGDAFGQDTLQITNTSGTRGSNIGVSLNMANRTHSIGGITIAIRFDTTVVRLTGVTSTPRTVIWETFPNLWDVDTVNYPGNVRIVAFSWRGDVVAAGTGAIANFSFLIKTTAPTGPSTLRFVTLVEGDNTLSDATGNSLFPVLVNGTITVGTTQNTAPQINIGATQYDATVGSTLQFNVSATDANNDSVTLSAINVPSGASFPTVRGYQVAQGTFSFTPTENQASQNYDVIFSATDNINAPTTQTVTIHVGTSGGGNHAPVISPLNTQTVTEGQHLEFSVSATDQDGDFITLTANSLPAHAQFPTASGTGTATGHFTFDPDFNQGGAVISVTFTARDALGASGQRTVDINVLDVPNDFLKVASNQGALSGSMGRSLYINLTNAKPIYGLQFDFLYDSDILNISSAFPATRAQDLAFFSQGMADGRYRVMIFSMGNETIQAGNDTIVTFQVDVDSRATFGPKGVTFDSATSVQDSIGLSKAIIFSPDTFTVDQLGDANLDGLVSVGDCVAIVASLLRRMTFNLRAADAADFNRDAQVRISDLMLVVNHILGRTVLSPPIPYRAGNVELIRDGLAPGNRAMLPLLATLDNPGAGVQFAIDYDSTEIRFHGITPGSLISGMRLDYQDVGNRIVGIIYDLDLSVFGPGTGELAQLDVEAIGDDPKPGNTLRITDFQMVNIDAQTLNIKVLGELPHSYMLNQNYPNPFNSSTVITFELPASSTVKLSIYNVLGQEVNVLEDGFLEAGSHNTIWDGKDSQGNQVSSGVYFYRLQAQDFNETKRMLLVK
jgi:hypothetical protein